MSSLKQIEANRRNAQKSTGPKTPEGKNACRFNAVRHGFTSQRFTVDHEDEAEFGAFRDEFFQEHAPATATEAFLVEQMVAAAWRIRRIRLTETAYWNMKMSDTEKDLNRSYNIIEDRDHLAHALQHKFTAGTSIDNLARYETRLERAFYKALHELERLRRERPPQQIGSVSQTPKSAPKVVAIIAPPEPAEPLEPASEPASPPNKKDRGSLPGLS